MRRSVATLVFLACFQFLVPTPAYAFWRWLDELTGPAPGGFDLQWRVVCLPGAQPVVDDVDGRLAQAIVAALLESGCLFQPKVVPKASVNLEIGFMRAYRNPLQYAPGVSRDVNFRLVEPALSVNLDPERRRRAVELGVGVGALFISGPAFESFTRMFIDVVRVDVKPFVKVPRLDGLVVRGILTVFPRGFNSAEFGAIPGSSDRPSEVQLSVALSYDFRPLLLR